MTAPRSAFPRRGPSVVCRPSLVMAPNRANDPVDSPTGTVSVTKLVGMDGYPMDASRPVATLAIGTPALAAGSSVAPRSASDLRCSTVDFSSVPSQRRYTRGGRRCVVEASAPPAPHSPIDLSHGEPDPAWPADPFWRDKIRIATEAAALGRCLRAGRPVSLRPALVPWAPACSVVAW